VLAWLSRQIADRRVQASFSRGRKRVIQRIDRVYEKSHAGGLALKAAIAGRLPLRRGFEEKDAAVYLSLWQ